MNFRSMAAVAATGLFALAACGGGSSPSAARPSGNGPVRSTGAISTPLPASAATQPSSAPTVAVPSTGGGVTGGTCSLLTPADLQAALGKAYAPGTDDGSGQCLWNTPGAQGNTGDLVIAYIQPADFTTIKTAFSAGGSDTTVAGHAAFWNPTQGLGSMWVDLGGGQTFVLSFPRSEDLDPSYQAIAQKLAETAVGKM